MNPDNIFSVIPDKSGQEAIEQLLVKKDIKIERIISKGHKSPETGWHDQELNEWVLVLKGKATLAFEDQTSVDLIEGSYINIPSHTKHKVTWTDPNRETIWLAVHY